MKQDSPVLASVATEVGAAPLDPQRNVPAELIYFLSLFHVVRYLNKILENFFFSKQETMTHSILPCLQQWEFCTLQWSHTPDLEPAAAWWHSGDWEVWKNMLTTKDCCITITTLGKKINRNQRNVWVNDQVLMWVLGTLSYLKEDKMCVNVKSKTI